MNCELFLLSYLRWCFSHSCFTKRAHDLQWREARLVGDFLFGAWCVAQLLQQSAQPVFRYPLLWVLLERPAKVSRERRAARVKMLRHEKTPIAIHERTTVGVFVFFLWPRELVKDDRSQRA